MASLKFSGEDPKCFLVPIVRSVYNKLEGVRHSQCFIHPALHPQNRGSWGLAQIHRCPDSSTLPGQRSRGAKSSGVPGATMDLSVSAVLRLGPHPMEWRTEC